MESNYDLQKMQIFQSIQKHFATLGIAKSQITQKYLLNVKNVLGWFMLWQYTCSTSAFFLFEAITFREYAESYYISSTVFGATLNCTYVVLKVAEVFDLILHLERDPKT